jgi:hypothetical protein
MRVSERVTNDNTKLVPKTDIPGRALRDEPQGRPLVAAAVGETGPHLDGKRHSALPYGR